MLTGMKGKGLCHNYRDIKTPARTLVLSVDEYLVPNAVRAHLPVWLFLIGITSHSLQLAGINIAPRAPMTPRA